MENLSGQVTGSEITAIEWNQFPQEVQLAITSSGITLAAALDQFAKACARYSGRSDFYTGGGAADAQTLTVLTGLARVSDFTTGLIVHWRPTNANTGATTLQLGPLSAKALVTEANVALVGGELVTTKDAKARYDGTVDKFFLIGA